jgi:hypothetical protein
LFVGKSGEVEVVIRQRAHLPDHLAHELAAIAHFEFGEVFGFAGDDFAEFVQQLSARCARHLAPRPLQRALGGLDGSVDVGNVAVGYPRPRTSGERVGAVVGGARRCRNQFAADRHLELE